MDSSIGNQNFRIFDKSKVNLDKEIGSGSFGKVYKATIRDAKLPAVAIKVFWDDMKQSQEKQRQRAYEELNKCSMLEHENVVKLIGIVENETPWLIFEYMRDGNLLEYLHRKKGEIKEKNLVRFCRDISTGMHYLHCNKILHKDLAARNILLDVNNKRAKIADLGLSSLIRDDDRIYNLGGKLFPYRHSPAECVVEEIFTFESDVWSFGVVMWEMWTGGRTPYGRENKQPEVRRFIVDGKSPLDFRKPACSSNIAKILLSIFQISRDKRPTFEELRAWFESVLNKEKIEMPNPHLREASPFRTRNVRVDARPNQHQLSVEDAGDHPKLQRTASESQQPPMLKAPPEEAARHSRTKFLTVSSRSGSPLSSSTPNLSITGSATVSSHQKKKRPAMSVNTPGSNENLNISNSNANGNSEAFGYEDELYHRGNQYLQTTSMTPPAQLPSSFGGRRGSEIPQFQEISERVSSNPSLFNRPLELSGRTGSGPIAINRGNNPEILQSGLVLNRFGPRKVM